MKLKTGDKVTYVWFTGIPGSSISPLKREERSGWIKDLDSQLNGSQRVKIAGAAGWVSVERILSVNGVAVQKEAA